MKQNTPDHNDQENQPADHLMVPPLKNPRVLNIIPEPPSATMITTVSNALTSNPQVMKLLGDV
jgi:hypothetical protein